MLLNPQAILIAVAALGMFGYHLLGFAVLLGGPEVLPRWIRALVETSKPSPRSVPLKALGLTWVVLMTSVSLAITAGAAGQYIGLGSRMVLLGTLLLMAGWTVYLWTLYHRPR